PTRHRGAGGPAAERGVRGERLAGRGGDATPRRARVLPPRGPHDPRVRRRAAAARAAGRALDGVPARADLVDRGDDRRGRRGDHRGAGRAHDLRTAPRGDHRHRLGRRAARRGGAAQGSLRPARRDRPRGDAHRDPAAPPDRRRGPRRAHARPARRAGRRDGRRPRRQPHRVRRRGREQRQPARGCPHRGGEVAVHAGGRRAQGVRRRRHHDLPARRGDHDAARPDRGAATVRSGRGTARVGCSGWAYRDWRGPVYPEDAPQRSWFEHYARRFDTVEINNTFYRLPPPAQVERWRDQAPPGFCYAVKVGRYGTHRKKLRDADQWLARHLERVELLGDALGPNLVQLPPNWRRDAARLDSFLEVAPRHVRWAVEVRHESWLHDEVLDVLARHGAALCVHDLLPGHPWVRTTDWAYVRFHGTDA